MRTVATLYDLAELALIRINISTNELFQKRSILHKKMISMSYKYGDILVSHFH